MKICMVASAGGHLSELLCIKDCCRGCDVIWVSTIKEVMENLKKLGSVYNIGECNRNHPIKTFMVLIRCIKIAYSERPDIVICSGAAPGLLLCLSSKILGAKLVWLDSIANVKRLSLSGRLVRPFCDLFLTQWPDLAEQYKNVEFEGTVI